MGPSCSTIGERVALYCIANELRAVWNAANDALGIDGTGVMGGT